MVDKVKFKQLADEIRSELIATALVLIEQKLNTDDLELAEEVFDLLVQDLKRLNFAKKIADK